MLYRTLGSRDYQGNFTGTGYASIGGQQLMSGAFSGHIQINADCSAVDTFTLKVDGVGALPGTGIERLVVLDKTPYWGCDPPVPRLFQITRSTGETLQLGHGARADRVWGTGGSDRHKQT